MCFSKQKLGTTGQIYKGFERDEMLNFSASFRRNKKIIIIFETTRSNTNLPLVSKAAYLLSNVFIKFLSLF